MFYGVADTHTGAVAPSKVVEVNREPLTTREVARAAVRASLASVANELFRRYGFHNVTIDDVAAAAGVHRTTFLRYFPTKEDAVVGFWDEQADVVADTLRTRPADEDDWTALRRALDPCVEMVVRDPGGVLARTRLIRDTPTLWAKHLEKQSKLIPAFAEALANRGGGSESVSMRHEVSVGSALACMDVAVEEWAAAEGRHSFVDLLDDTFAACAS